MHVDAAELLHPLPSGVLAVDPKGCAGDPAYDAGTAIKAHLLFLLAEDHLVRAVRRSMDIFTDAAGLDPDRVRRWCQLHALQTVFWTRSPGAWPSCSPRRSEALLPKRPVCATMKA